MERERYSMSIRHPARLYLRMAFCTTIAFFSGCASLKPPVWGSQEKGYEASYRGEPGDILQYAYALHSTYSTENEEDGFDYASSRSYRFHLTMEKSDSLLTYVLTVDTIGQVVEYGDAVIHSRFGEIAGKRAKLVLYPDGRQKEITAIDSLPDERMGGFEGYGSRRNSAERFSPAFYRLIQKPLRPHDSWTETENDTTVQADSLSGRHSCTITRRKTQYRIGDIEEKAGFSCLPIHVESVIERELSRSLHTDIMQREEEGEEKTDAWFAFREGILVEYRWERFAEGAEAYSGQYAGIQPFAEGAHASMKLIRRLPMHTVQKSGSGPCP